MNLILIASLIASGLILMVFIYTYSGTIYTNWKLHVGKKAAYNLPARKPENLRILPPIHIRIINW
jgi:hypothetical protein